jgi:hypothetical protein
MKFSLPIVTLLAAALLCSLTSALPLPESSASFSQVPGGVVDTRNNKRFVLHSEKVETICFPSSDRLANICGGAEKEEKNGIAHPTLVRGGNAASPALMDRLKIGFYFALWYFLNIVYNSKCVAVCLPAGGGEFMVHGRLAFVK